MAVFLAGVDRGGTPSRRSFVSSSVWEMRYLATIKQNTKTTTSAWLLPLPLLPIASFFFKPTTSNQSIKQSKMGNKVSLEENLIELRIVSKQVRCLHWVSLLRHRRPRLESLFFGRARRRRQTSFCNHGINV